MAEKQTVQEAVEEYCTALRRRQIEGSLPCAKKTADILRLLVTNQRHADAAALIDDVRACGYKMQNAKPVELAIGNMVRRVLHIIREEAKQEEMDDHRPSVSAPAYPEAPRNQAGLLSQALKSRIQIARGPSLSNLLEVGIDEAFMPTLQAINEGTSEAMMDRPEAEVESQASTRKPRSKGPPNWKGKHEVIESINELIDELDHIQQSITAQGVEHIHANEVILTLGMSDTTYHFLKEASKKREFQVVVSEGAPKFDGHEMARKLGDAGIQTTLIADSAVYAMMARANKVLVGAHAVLANGGVIAPVGMHMVALAAKQHSIPFVVLVGLHKLSPLFPHDPDLAYNDFKSPADVVDFAVVAEGFTQQDRILQADTPGGAAAASSPPSTSAAFGRLDPLPGSVHVPNPLFDYVPPHLISLFITDMGGRTPSYVYRLLTEYYSREDYLLSKELNFNKGG